MSGSELGGGRRVPTRRGAAGWGVIAVLVILVLLVVALWIARHGARREAVVTTRGGSGAGVRAGGAATGTAAVGGATAMTVRGVPFDGCPVDGDGGDRELNRLKNREAPGAWQDVPLDSILALPWPRSVGDRRRERWPAAARRAVAPDEARAVRVEGYLVLARSSGPESVNCHGKEARYRDYHLWLTTDPSLDRSVSVIAEMTPRLRAEHTRWNIRTLNGVSRRRERVRVSGWLLLDQEHPEQLGRTRGTLWEVHPVIRFEVRRGSRWVPLDDLRD